MYRVRTQITGGPGGDGLSTFYFNVIGGLTAANAVADTHAFWEALKGHIWNGYHMTTEADVFEIDVLTGQPTGVVSVTSTTTTGTRSNDPLPFQCQGLLRWSTGVFVGGREVRGRTFIPGPTEDENTAGVPEGFYKSAVDAAASALISSSVSDLVVYSRKNRDAVPALGGSCWTKWADLSSRRD